MQFREIIEAVKQRCNYSTKTAMSASAVALHRLKIHNKVKRVGFGLWAFNFVEASQPINQIEAEKREERGQIVGFDKGVFRNYD
jgi:hypothetical protein